MRRVLGVKKDTEPPPSVQDAFDRINKRGENVDEKIQKLDAELVRYKEQIKKTRPGTLETVKARAMRVLKQKRCMKVSVICYTIRHSTLIKFHLLLKESKMLNKHFEVSKQRS